MENIENRESVRITTESNFKMFLIGSIQGFHDKEILQIFSRSVKNHHIKFQYFSILIALGN